jgi:hypothetical protein
MVDVGDAMSQMRKLIWNDVEIPYQEITIDGAIDDHEHKYPHTAGAANEKLGRKLYLVTVKAQFDEQLISSRYAALYPGRLNTLLRGFEQQITAKMVLPNRGGEFQAYCTNWSTTLSVKIRSGEAVVLKFKEDRNEELLTAQNLEIQRRNLMDQNQALQGATDGFSGNIWDEITNGVNGVLAYLDQAELYGNLVAAKIEGLVQLIKTADETISELNDPANYAALEELHRLWETMLDVKDDLFEGGSKLRQYTTLTDGTVTDAAIAIYQDASKAGDLLGLNVIQDPLLIPAATTLNYYPAD